MLRVAMGLYQSHNENAIILYIDFVCIRKQINYIFSDIYSICI